MANFLGKKISLISKAGIRYEGILYTIDPTESTVALSKVKSFGTEDRPSERFISPRDEVYEYIIFRGSDIRDLHVCENSLYSEDSAIVKIMSPNFTNQPPHVPLPQHGIDVGVPDIHPQNQERSPSGFHSTPNQNDNRIINNHLLSSKSLDRDSLGHSENKPIQTPRTHDKSELQKDKDEKFDMDKIAANDYHNFLNRDQSFKYDTYINDEFRENSNYRRGGGGQRQRGMKNQDSRRGSQFSGSNGNVILNNNRGYRANKEVTIEPIKDDFDFESSNAILAEELANINVSNDDNNRVGNLSESKEPSDQNLADYVEEKLYYDKSKSFFDNISSETSERTNSERRNERRSNTETFGDSNYNRNNRGNRWGNRRGHFRGNYSRGSSAGFLRRGNYLNRGDMRGHGQVSGSINKRLIPVGGNRGNMNEN